MWPDLGGPHSLFLPLNDDRFFIDYAWVQRVLYNLFFNIRVSDQNFKGDALEEIVHRRRSVLPTGPCLALNGESRQVDAAFEVGDSLVIVECRAVARSFGVDRGDVRAIQFRTELVDRTLNDIDEKARWLAANPVGTNYDVRKYKSIIPVGVTPFVEYMPSLDPFYWLNEKTPRVLTPFELKNALDDGTLEATSGSAASRISVRNI
jgi:hypothetical protein